MQGGSLAAVLNPGYLPVQEEAALQPLGQVLHQAAQGTVQQEVRVPCETSAHLNLLQKRLGKKTP